jgi:general secretion pathway protein A
VEEVRQALHQREGLVVVTGETGTGKTMFCRTLLQLLDTPVCVSIVLDPCLTVDDLLIHVLTDFGVIREGQETRSPGLRTPARHQLVTALQRFLMSLIPLDAYAVIVIDEAQHLDLGVLEQIRLLLNFETDQAKLLQVVLVGPPDLDRLLRRPEMRQLNQRVARRCELHPLSGHEVKGYIERRLSVAQRLALLEDTQALQLSDVDVETQSWRVRFTPSAVRAVVRLSSGIPRLVNLLCDRALEIDCERRMRTIDARSVNMAARRLNVRMAMIPGIRGPRGAAALTATLVLLAAGPIVWTWDTRRPALPPQSPPATTALVPVSGNSARAVSGSVAMGELPVVDGFNITVASFSKEPQAAAVAAQLEAAGLPAFTRRLQRAQWHQVIVGPYVSEPEATTVQQRLTAYGYSNTHLSVDDEQWFNGKADEPKAPGSVVERVRVLER